MKGQRKKDTVKLFLEQVGDNIRYYRIQKGYTLEALGSDLGIDKSNMFRIEQGKNITLITLLKISAFLDVSPARLIQNVPNIILEDAESYVRKKN
jgi:transcriptional regulator with XRE-family HTH domain